MKSTLPVAAAVAVVAAALTITPAAAQQPPPTAADLCALATTDTIAKIRATPELRGLVPAGLPSNAAAAAARVALDCDGQRPDAAEAKVRVCAALTVSGLATLATRLGATPGVKSNITVANVAAARRAVACADAAATATPAAGGGGPATTTPAPTPAPAAGFVDLDCDDFPNRAAAQAKLDETPTADPHRLDADNDRLACEVGETENTTPIVVPAAGGSGGSTGGSFTQVGADDVPRGGVDTGA